MAEDVCRICLAPGTPDEPLFHPCRCRGSIRYVHQDCLFEWLKHAHIDNQCDLCRSKLQFENVYRSNMPHRIPILVFAKWTMGRVLYMGRMIFALLLHLSVLIGLIVAAKYGFELTTIHAEMSISTLLPRTPEALVERISSARQPYVNPPFALDWPRHRHLQELTVAIIDGIFILAVCLVVAVLSWVVTMWTLTDPALLDDIDHLSRGEPGHMDLGDYLDDENLTEDENVAVGEDFVPEANAEGLREEVRREAEDAAIAAGLGDLLDQQEDEDEAALGNLVWDTVVELATGPILNNIASIVVLGTVAMAIFLMAYGLPLISTSLLIAAASFVLKRQVGFYTTPEACVGCVVLVYMFLFMAIKRWEQYNIDKLLQTQGGRWFLVLFRRVHTAAKCFMVVIIELFLFPEMCGIIMHIVALPILPSSKSWMLQHSWVVLSAQWAAGFSFMYLLVAFMNSCRTFLRPGTLYFAQDPRDREFAPLHSVISQPLVEHLRKIGMSAVVYGGLIFSGFPLPLLVRAWIPSTWPLQLYSTPSVLAIAKLWPLWLPAHALWTQRLISTARVFEIFTSIWQTTFTFAARKLDLESWLFRGPRHGLNGRWVRVPAQDNFRSRKGLRIFVEVDEHNNRMDGLGQNVQANELREYFVVWRPRFFWWRLAALYLCIWIVAAWMSLYFTLAPVVVGRVVDKIALGGLLRNDGLRFLCGLLITTPLLAFVTAHVPPLPAKPLDYAIRRALELRIVYLRSATLLTQHALLDIVLITLLIYWFDYGGFFWLPFGMTIAQFALGRDNCPTFVQTGAILIALHPMLPSGSTVIKNWEESARNEAYLETSRLKNLPDDSPETGVVE